MSRTLSIRNRQRLRPIDTSLLRRLTLQVLQRLGVSRFELAIHLVAADEMAQVNETFLNHSGSTDVITFNHSDEMGTVPPSAKHFSKRKTAALLAATLPSRKGAGDRPSLHGELFICLNDAVKQAREFRSTWQSELVRYVIHGLLHLCGYDDVKPAARRRMKREENRILNLIAQTFAIVRLKKQGTPGIRRRDSAI